ncbi:MAG: AI-2E family transporter [Nocardioides sp.]
MTRTALPARDPLPRGLMILAGLAAATLAVAGLKSAAGLIAPATLALVLMITVHPVRDWLTARGVPGWLAATATVVTVYVVLLAMIVSLAVSVGRLATLVPTYAPQINDLVVQIGDWLEARGVGREQVDAVVSSLDIGKVFSVATALLSGALGVLSNLLFIATLALFIGVDAGRFPRLLRDARDHRPAVVDALGAFAAGTRKYVAVSAGFGLVVAVIDTVALALLGIPGALVWGVLSFVTNFIPNIGFVIGLIPPAVLALLEGGPGLMLAVVIVYSAINVVIQSVIQPKIVGDALGLSTTVTFLSLVFWAWVLGPLGAILALPLTLLAKALLVDVDPRSRWLGPLLSGNHDTAGAASAAAPPG